MINLTPETAAALRGRAGVAERLALSREQVLTLLDAADERDELAAVVQRVRQACHEPRYVRNVPESITFEQGYRDALETILTILEES